MQVKSSTNFQFRPVQSPQVAKGSKLEEQPEDAFVRGAAGLAGGLLTGTASFFAVGRVAGAIARAINPPTNPLDLADLSWAVGMGAVAGLAGIAGGVYLGEAAYERLAS